MDVFEFFSSLVQALAWPLTILIVVFLLHDEIAMLVPLLRRVRAGPVEAEFEKEVKELTEIAATGYIEKHQQKDLASHGFLVQLADLHPRAAILEAWVRVEAAARAVLAHESTSVANPNYMPASKLAELLAEKHFISAADVTLYHEIRRLRNDVAHAQDFEPAQQSARQYIDLAAVLLKKLESGHR